MRSNSRRRSRSASRDRSTSLDTDHSSREKTVKKHKKKRKRNGKHSSVSSSTGSSRSRSPASDYRRERSRVHARDKKLKHRRSRSRSSHSQNRRRTRSRSAERQRRRRRSKDARKRSDSSDSGTDRSRSSKHVNRRSRSQSAELRRRRRKSRSHSFDRRRRRRGRSRSGSSPRRQKRRSRSRSAEHGRSGRSRSVELERSKRKRKRCQSDFSSSEDRSEQSQRKRKKKRRSSDSSDRSRSDSREKRRKNRDGGSSHKSKKKKRSSSRENACSSSSSSEDKEKSKGSQSLPKAEKLPDKRSNDRQSRSRSKSSVSSVSSVSRSRSRSPDSDVRQKLSLQESLKLAEETVKKKEMMKAMETPEEKRARRLAKKEAKERKKREKMGWGEEYMGYTNADNPFGDNNLLGAFIWNKALDKKGIGHLNEKEIKDRNKQILEGNRLELQKVKQLRLEREREKAMREQELEMLQREKEAEHFKTWEEQEDNFHLQQAKLRSKIRIRDGRAKPIDLLAKYISAEDDDLAVEMHEPYTFLNGLTVHDLDDLLEDIRIYMELEQGKNADFWRDMTIITEDEISKLRKLEASGKGPGERREGVNASVSSDVQAVFKGKTYSQLQVLYQGIEGKIRAGGPNLDIGYWETLLQQLKAYMARARLRERHQDVLRQKLYKLKQEQGVDSEPLFPIIKKEPESPEERLRVQDESREEPGSTVSRSPEQQADAEERNTEDEDKEEQEEEEEGEAVLMEEDLIQQSLDEYDSGRYSPHLLMPNELPLDSHVVDPEEDLERLMLARKQLQVTGDASESAEDVFVRRAKEGMGGDEAQFSVEVPLTAKAYLWADKYRPRKPRFFNRVHTGFEWNKYNQTHYDFDNPPPKIVQGYKFNIFYPDLIDKRSTPEYYLETCPDNKDFAVLRFHAGPPYEDIAFKIVNREWEYSHRHGFRCQFANGIFQLWFHFKRYRYRR
ncbi:cactin [Protopterus annectens]|uniref:cactin n=1 Tax=Protopterus annectens TaxID=7888 RepID=UPI001CF9453E|nr:cactin [Protopterus annectens]